MKKKTISILTVIIILWACIFTTDYVRVKKSKPPVFSKLTDIYEDGGSKEYLGLGYKIIKFNELEDGRKHTVITSWFLDINHIN